MPAEIASPIDFPASRDVSRTEQRHGTYERLRRRFRRDLGFRDVPLIYTLVADQAAQDSEQRDQIYFETIRDREHDVLEPPKLTASFDKQHRVETMNREYLDHMTERYAHKVLDTEEDHEKKKYDEGRWGRAQRFLGETYLGRTLKIGVKGALAVAGGVFGGPLGIYALKKLGTDVALEAIQFYGYEAPVMDRLRAMKEQRVNLIGRLQEVRNTRFSNDEGEAITGALKTELEEIINRVDPTQSDLTLARPGELGLEQVETEINRLEQRVAVIREWGQAIRSLAGIGWSLQTVHEFLTKGFAFWRDYDSDGVKHLVKITKDIFTHGSEGFRFIQNIVSSDGVRHISSHILGPGSLKAAAEMAGLAAGLVGSTIHEVKSFLHQRRIVHNPKEAAVMSFRGRTALGNAEKEFAPLVRPQDSLSGQSDKEKAAEKKAEISVGSVVEMTVPGGWGSGTPPFPHAAGTKILIVIESNDDNGVKFHVLKRTSLEPEKNASGGIQHWNQENPSDAFYLSLKKIDNSVDEYKVKRGNAAWEKLKKDAEKKGAIPEVDQEWRADNIGADLRQPGGGVLRTLTANDRIVIKSLTQSPVPTATVWIYDDINATPVKKGPVLLEDIVKNCHYEGKRGEEENDADYTIFRAKIERKLGQPLRQNEKWTIDNVHWYAILNVTDSNVSYTTDVLPVPPAPLPSDKDMRNYPARTDTLDVFWRTIIEPAAVYVNAGPLRK